MWISIDQCASVRFSPYASSGTCVFGLTLTSAVHYGNGIARVLGMPSAFGSSPRASQDSPHRLAMAATGDFGTLGGGVASDVGAGVGDVGLLGGDGGDRFNAMVTVVRAVGVHPKIADSLSKELCMMYGAQVAQSSLHRSVSVHRGVAVACVR